MRQFIIQAPDGRLLEPRGAEGLETLKAGLLPGFEIAFEVLDGTFQVEPLPDGLPEYSLMSYLLHKHGDELRAWLKKK